MRVSRAVAQLSSGRLILDCGHVLPKNAGGRSINFIVCLKCNPSLRAAYEYARSTVAA